MEHNAVDNQKFESFVQLQETPEEIAFELRAQEGALWTGGRLLIGIWAFAFAALAFAYFYLRSANDEDLWRPKGITAPTATGAAIFAITVAAALLVQFGEARVWNHRNSFFIQIVLLPHRIERLKNASRVIRFTVFVTSGV